MVETERHDTALVKKDSALTGAAVSAAVGVALYALRKALSEGGGGLSIREPEPRDEHHEGESDASLLVTIWDAASDAILPLADSAADAAGRWAAAKAPVVVRERLLPRFIDSFRAAA
jgi:hypothetical protein